MNRLRSSQLALLAGCAAVRRRRHAPTPHADYRSRSASAAHSPNALTPVATPKRRSRSRGSASGCCSDQASVTFPRIDGGYYLVADDGAVDAAPRVHRRRAAADSAPVRYAVQVSAYLRQAERRGVRGEAPHRDRPARRRVFDPSAANGGVYRIFAGDFPDEAGAIRCAISSPSAATARTCSSCAARPISRSRSSIVITDDEGDRLHDRRPRRSS